MLLGLAAVLANAVVGAFAGVWFEKVIKAARPDGRTTNLWVSNLQVPPHTCHICIIRPVPYIGMHHIVYA